MFRIKAYVWIINPKSGCHDPGKVVRNLNGRQDFCQTVSCILLQALGHDSQCTPCSLI
jgi:hypothetical protein